MITTEEAKRLFEESFGHLPKRDPRRKAAASMLKTMKDFDQVDKDYAALQVTIKESKKIDQTSK